MIDEKKRKKHLLIFIIAIIFIFVCLLPFIIELIYNVEPSCDFFNVEFEAKELLSYYGSALSFLGASILGILTLLQNKTAQEKSNEVNELQLELQRRSMAIAEAQYSKENEDATTAPSFEIELSGYNGSYAQLKISIKNISSVIVSAITPLNFYIFQNDEMLFGDNIHMTIENRSLASFKSTNVKTDTPNLTTEKQGQRNHLNDVKLIFKFSCQDEKGKIHYYNAYVVVDNTGTFCKDLWTVEKVG